MKEIEKQESRGAVSLRADSRPKAGSEKVILSESEPEYTRQVTFQGNGGEGWAGQKGGGSKGKGVYWGHLRLPQEDRKSRKERDQGVAGAAPWTTGRTIVRKDKSQLRHQQALLRDRCNQS